MHLELFTNAFLRWRPDEEPGKFLILWNDEIIYTSRDLPLTLDASCSFEEEGTSIA